MPEERHPRGLIDTSVVIEIEHVAADALPAEVAVSAITFAELAAGPHATDDPAERARRQDRLQRAEATFEPIPFDGPAARAYGLVYAATVSAGRKAKGHRAVDLLIAATAVAAGLPVYTRNPSDFAGLDAWLEVVTVGPAQRPDPFRFLSGQHQLRDEPSPRPCQCRDENRADPIGDRITRQHQDRAIATQHGGEPDLSPLHSPSRSNPSRDLLAERRPCRVACILLVDGGSSLPGDARPPER